MSGPHHISEVTRQIRRRYVTWRDYKSLDRKDKTSNLRTRNVMSLNLLSTLTGNCRSSLQGNKEMQMIPHLMEIQLDTMSGWCVLLGYTRLPSSSSSKVEILRMPSIVKMKRTPCGKLMWSDSERVRSARSESKVRNLSLATAYTMPLK